MTDGHIEPVADFDHWRTGHLSDAPVVHFNFPECADAAIVGTCSAAGTAGGIFGDRLPGIAGEGWECSTFTLQPAPDRRSAGGGDSPQNPQCVHHHCFRYGDPVGVAMDCADDSLGTGL